MKTQKLFVLGSPTNRCSFVWFGQPPEESDNFYPTFSLFKEHEIDSIKENTDGTFDVKLKNVDFTYKHIKSVKEK